MMSVEVLIAVNNEIARKAAREGLVPYVPISADEVDIAVRLPEHRLAEASRLAEDRCELVCGQDGAWVGLGTRPDLAAVPAAARGIHPPPPRPWIRHHRRGRMPGRRVGVPEKIRVSAELYVVPVEEMNMNAKLVLPIKFSKRATDAEGLASAMDNVVKCGMSALSDCWNEYGGEPKVGEFTVLDTEAAAEYANALDALIDGQNDDGLGEVLVPVRDFLRSWRNDGPEST